MNISDTRAVLPTRQASLGQRRFALSVVLVCLVVFLCVAPFAKITLATVPAFIPIYESGLVATSLITAALLLGQFAFLRSRELLVLACAYQFSAFMAVAHALAFPGLFSATGLLGTGAQTAPAIYLLWHGVFPLFIIAYVLMKGRDPQPGSHSLNIRPGAIGFAGMAMVLALTCFLTWVATTNQLALPAIMTGHLHTPAMTMLAGSIALASLLALATLWQRRPHSAMDIWLMAVMCAWLFELALSVALNTGHFDLGFYVGRIFGLLASSFLLMMLLVESSMLYAGLVEFYDRERRERRRIMERTAELKTANNELTAVAEALSQDLRPPLLAMDKLVRTLETDHGNQVPAEGVRLLADLRSSTRMMERLLDALLAFSGIGCSPLKPELLPLDKVAREIADEVVATTSGREIKVIVDKLGQTRADPELLSLVLRNLIDNAVKFTRGTPIAVIEIGRTLPQSGGATIYHVKDNGAGFDMRSANSLFRLFLRLHSSEDFEGIGAGLAITQLIIERHGGRVWAESMPGSGASFYFTLQSSQAARNAAGSDDYEPDPFQR